MRKPLIGVMPLVDEYKHSYWMLPGYMKAIEEAGGIPVMLPLSSHSSLLEQIITTLDGLLFTGGHDINPELYGQTASPACGTVIAERDEMEKRLFQLAHALDLPMLGICRGLQLFNSLLGGTLYQDLPSEYPSELTHVQQPPYHLPVHEVKLERRSSLYRLLEQDKLQVNSYHHQAICNLAPGCQVMARSSDGLIEAIEHPSYQYLQAVQWHPELSYEQDRASQLLFSSFVQAASVRC
jgi:putative glutamine amidotransferase